MPRVSPAKPSKARAVASATPTPIISRITYRRDEAAEALGVSVQTIDAWVAAGLLRASKPPGVSGKPGRYLLIRAADIEAMLVASAVAA
jgi:excisionase family DNA binding protein